MQSEDFDHEWYNNAKRGSVDQYFVGGEMKNVKQLEQLNNAVSNRKDKRYDARSKTNGPHFFHFYKV